MNYYNEFDPYCAKWIGNLIDKKLIPNGDVDCRDIKEVTSNDLKGYTQHHFFAGIAGWSIALRIAGFPEDQKVWTASLPCQPFSLSGKLLGEKDERHLWPYYKELVQKRKPPIMFGEQVSKRPGLNWLSSVRTDLEKIGYEVGASDLPAAGVGAPHIRQRIHWGAVLDTHTVINILQRRVSKRKWRQRSFDSLVRKSISTAVSTSKSGLLVDGVQQRTPKLRAYGNAIVPDLGAVFVKNFLLACQDRFN